MDALTAFSAAFIRSPDIDRLYQLMGRVRRQFGHIRILPSLLNEKLKIIGPAHHGKAVITDPLFVLFKLLLLSAKDLFGFALQLRLTDFPEMTFIMALLTARIFRLVSLA